MARARPRHVERGEAGARDGGARHLRRRAHHERRRRRPDGQRLPACWTATSPSTSQRLRGRDRAHRGAAAGPAGAARRAAPERRLRTLFTILDRSFLVTLTAQCPEARYAELGPTYKEVLDSFKFK